ncbi:MAG: shikimate kinase [Arcobacter sp.]|nr:shikimate kinase [Arcobacter sp.]
MKKENLILIGFMGVGKGTIARELSKTMDKFCIDTDDLIESYENKKIKKIFELYGEEYFRDLEKKTALWLEKNVSESIISTGGGFYRQENLKSIGKVVYLKSSFEGIIKRLENSPNAKKKFEKRPLLKNLEEAKKLFDIRVKEYEKVANLTIDVEDKNLEKIVLEIKEKI